MDTPAPSPPNSAPPGAPHLSRNEQLARLVLALLIALGCALVLWPFLPAILFSTAIALATWPLHLHLLKRLHDWPVAASLISCLGVILIVVTPTLLLMMSLREGATWLLGLLNQWRAGQQPPLPEWLASLPLAGGQLRQWWLALGSAEGGAESLLADLADPARRAALASARALGNGLMQVLIAALLLYLLYRNGAVLALRMRSAAERLGGRQGLELLHRAQATLTGVMVSVIGAALAQATVATAGFAIAGVPNPFLLGALTFALSIVPVGPPIIWGSATLWLVQQGQPGWALFMFFYGLLGISGIDNVLKPYLISRTSSLPFALTLISIIGGVIAFGVAGVLLGPLLLAPALDYFSHRYPDPDAPPAA